ncbi:MAG TPA: histone deacetylase, partial [Chloroflexota bacterium]|nr:histone deacetylase [Chloroflexota bacterium]
HGNGTQDIFYRRPEVLYYSTHQFPFYPGSGRVEETGEGDGAGYTLNVPLMAGCGDATYLAATDKILVPALRRFGPELILVSLGFDAHWADPLAQMRLSLNGYAEELSRIRGVAQEVCNGRIVLFLEGGYDLEVIQAGTRMAAEILIDHPLDRDMLGPGPTGEEPRLATDVITAVRDRHNLWSEK